MIPRVPTYTFGGDGQPTEWMRPSDSGGGGGGLTTIAIVTKPVAEARALDDSKVKCNTSKPVSITTGEKLKSEPDFAVEGMLGIGLKRQYRSKYAGGTLFGPNWLSNIDYPNLKFSSDVFFTEKKRRLYRSVVLTHPDGSKYDYSIDDAYAWNGYEAIYFSDGSIAAGQLTYRATGWTLEMAKKTYQYSTSGIIEKIIDRESGNTWTYQQLSTTVTTITTGGGQSIQLTKGPNGRVIQVIDPAGSTWNYSYNSGGMLTKVTPPSSSVGVREYHYENTSAVNAGTLLTGISVNGSRYSRYVYNADATVQQSGLAAIHPS